MIATFASLARPFLHMLPPETAHRVAIRGLSWLDTLPPRPAPDPRLSRSLFGLEFPNPLGLAAGFDKSAEAASALLSCGFGFVEVGTLTPRPQAGNPKPRLFRLEPDGGIVNRMGFNNDGYEAAKARLEAAPPPGVLGVNFGPNKDAADRVADFVLGVKTFAPLASYLTINVSSPNTVGLRDLQRREAFDDLVARVVEARDEAPARRPLFVKIAPDLDLRALDDICAVAIERGVDALIIANTTVERPPGLRSPFAEEAGGLSGRPLFALSTLVLARAYLRCEGRIRLIGCGGVDNAATALVKIEAGADLVQVYTGFVYRGPALIAEILDGLRAAVTARGARNLGDLVGLEALDYAAKP